MPPKAELGLAPHESVSPTALSDLFPEDKFFGLDRKVIGAIDQLEASLPDKTALFVWRAYSVGVGAGKTERDIARELGFSRVDFETALDKVADLGDLEEKLKGIVLAREETPRKKKKTGPKVKDMPEFLLHVADRGSTEKQNGNGRSERVIFDRGELSRASLATVKQVDWHDIVTPDWGEEEQIERKPRFYQANLARESEREALAVGGILPPAEIRRADWKMWQKIMIAVSENPEQVKHLQESYRPWWDALSSFYKIKDTTVNPAGTVRKESLLASANRSTLRQWRKRALIVLGLREGTVRDPGFSRKHNFIASNWQEIRTVDDIKTFGDGVDTVYLGSPPVARIGSVRLLLDQNPGLRAVKAPAYMSEVIMGRETSALLTARGVEIEFIVFRPGVKKVLRGMEYKKVQGLYKAMLQDPGRKAIFEKMLLLGFPEARVAESYFGKAIRIGRIAETLHSKQNTVARQLKRFEMWLIAGEASEAKANLARRLEFLEKKDQKRKASERLKEPVNGIRPPSDFRPTNYQVWKDLLVLIQDHPEHFKELQEAHPRWYKALATYYGLPALGDKTVESLSGNPRIQRASALKFLGIEHPARKNHR